MGDILNKVIINRKEQLIQQMLKWESYKSTDDRQLYELTLSELEHEYQKMYKDHSNIRWKPTLDRAVNLKCYAEHFRRKREYQTSNK